MQRFGTVAIVGVGLIGASIGLALRRKSLAGRIVGIGRRVESLAKAQQVGAVDETTTDLALGVAEADLVVVCTPVELIVGQVERIAAACPAACLITDAGSTKQAIVAALDESLPLTSHFVGSHPMAGSEQSGPEHAIAHLFDDRVVVVTPTQRTAAADVQKTADFWHGLGARVLEMPPDAHDRAVAATSHLPHLLASAIAASTPDGYFAVVGTGWLDTTRVAAGDPELWRQILLTNRHNVLAALDEFGRAVAGARSALESADGAALELFLTQAKRTRDAVGS